MCRIDFAVRAIDTLGKMSPDELGPLFSARRSTKTFDATPLQAGELQCLLGAVFGVAPDGRRSYGSAHARYPVAATAVVGDVRGLAVGSYRVFNGELREQTRGDHRKPVALATIDATWAAVCPALLVLSANVSTERAEFASQADSRGERFVAMEVGLIAQTVHLAAARLDIGTVLIAGLHNDMAQDLLASVVPSGEEMIAVMPLGRAATSHEPEHFP